MEETWTISTRIRTPQAPSMGGVSPTIMQKLAEAFPESTNKKNFSLRGSKEKILNSGVFNLLNDLDVKIQNHRGEKFPEVSLTKVRHYDQNELDLYKYHRPIITQQICVALDSHSGLPDIDPASYIKAEDWGAIAPYWTMIAITPELQLSLGLNKCNLQPFHSIGGRNYSVIWSEQTFFVENPIFNRKGEVSLGDAEDYNACMPIDDCYTIPQLRVSDISSEEDVLISKQFFSPQGGIKPYPICIYSNKLRKEMMRHGLEISWSPVKIVD